MSYGGDQYGSGGGSGGGQAGGYYNSSNQLYSFHLLQVESYC